MSRTVTARSLTLLLVLGLSAWFAPASPALAQSNQEVEVEGTNWFWRSQERRNLSDITGGCPEDLPLPLCPDPVIGLPNPHDPGALPVMVLNGEVEKISAIQFNTDFIPPQGGTIAKFEFSVVEATSPRDRIQTINAAERKIVACFIKDYWPTSEDAADELADAPPYDCASGVEGERQEAEEAGQPARWTFEATELVQDWGLDPFSANGIMLVPVVEGSGPTETWQIVLAGPRRDVAETPPPADEAEASKDNVKAQIAFTPNPEPEEDDGGFTGGGGDFGFDPPAPESPPADPPVSEPPPDTGERADEPASETTPVGSAWYVWLLVPAALVGVSMVRTAVLEPAGGKRPDGVVARIRAQNVARRGAPLHAAGPAGLGAALASPFAALAAAIRGDLSNARSKLRKRS